MQAENELTCKAVGKCNTCSFKSALSTCSLRLQAFSVCSGLLRAAGLTCSCLSRFLGSERQFKAQDFTYCVHCKQGRGKSSIGCAQLAQLERALAAKNSDLPSQRAQQHRHVRLWPWRTPHYCRVAQMQPWNELLGRQSDGQGCKLCKSCVRQQSALKRIPVACPSCGSLNEGSLVDEAAPPTPTSLGHFSGPSGLCLAYG